MNTKLTKDELAFCELYIYGGSGYAYQPARCWLTAMEGIVGDAVNKIQGVDELEYALKAKKLLKEAKIKEHINEMLDNEDGDFRAKVVREMLISTYQNVMIEASTHTSKDEEGNSYVSASLRNVAITAGKALSEMLPVKNNDNDEVGSATITFTVVAPDKKKDDDK